MKTYSQKGSEIKREWWIVDASTMPLGKLAVVIADKLMGNQRLPIRHTLITVTMLSL